MNPYIPVRPNIPAAEPDTADEADCMKLIVFAFACTFSKTYISADIPNALYIRKEVL